ncbi:armadillo-type protein [Coprinopsis sp. MPI-PUGE-AT-0042]|nr:armadillo-type protein [Coprinopsis sp. MPI-PUGE-AT-0042]
MQWDTNLRGSSISVEDTDYEEQLHQVIIGLLSSDRNAQLAATKQYRQLIYTDNPSIPLDPSMYDRGILRRLVDFLTYGHHPKLQFHTTWVFINITAGPLDQVQAVVDAQAVPQLVRLLRDSDDEATRELAIWVLGNIAAETLHHRDYVIKEGTMPPLIEFLSLDHEDSVTRTAVRGLRYICREAATLTAWHLDHLLPIIPVLPRLLLSDDAKVLAMSFWTANSLAAASSDAIQLLIDSGICEHLTRMILYPSLPVALGAIYTVGTMVCGTDDQVQVLIDHNVLLYLHEAFTSSSSRLLRAVCFAICNIAAGPPGHVKAIADAALIPLVIKLLTHGNAFDPDDPEGDLRKEACWALSNCLQYNDDTAPIIQHALDEGCLLPLCEYVKVARSDDIFEPLLKALQNILNYGQWCSSGNPYTSVVEESGAAFAIYRLQEHPIPEIRTLASNIIQKHYGGKSSADMELGSLTSDVAEMGIVRRTVNIDRELDDLTATMKRARFG